MNSRRTCLECGKPRPRANSKFCSHSCYARYYTGRQVPARKRRIRKVCQSCGKTFETGGRAGKATKIFCSITCAARGREKPIGAGPNYRRREKWRRLAGEIKKRDGWICVFCRERRTRLDVHHIIPAANGGAHSPENLVSLCVGCHVSIEHITRVLKSREKILNLWKVLLH